VGRCLEKHQAESAAVINSLHEQMLQMTTMMAQMQTSMNRFAPPEGTNNTDSLMVEQQRTFVTPPPRASTVLSPIQEVPTPQPTPQTTKQPPFPPKLGALSPEQLPFNPHPQPTRPNGPTVSTNTDPIVTTVAASSSTQQFTQVTNPSTQPQYYQQPPQ
jgi:hypothetical protein